MSSASTSQSCTSCGGPLEEGFVAIGGATGPQYWIRGEMRRWLSGAVRRFGRERYDVRTFRCSSCGHLEEFANI